MSKPVYRTDRVKRDILSDGNEQSAQRRFFAARPLKPDLGVLGHKWALLILADIGLRGVDRFSRLLDSNPLLTPRVRSRRLGGLELAGMIRKSEQGKKFVRWSLTEKGADVLPAVIRLVAFSARWDATDAFRGRLPKRLQ